MSYEARKFGVSRLLRGTDAKKLCPELELVEVPESRGKANLNRYREAGAEVIKILSQFSSLIERASVDEAFLDITDTVHKRIEAMGFDRVEAAMLHSTHVAGLRGTNAASHSVSASDTEEALNEETQGFSSTDTMPDGRSDQTSDESSDRDALLRQWLAREVEEEGRGEGEQIVLAVGALVAQDMRRAVLEGTGFTCSAGIAQNKVLQQ